jgi:hypothetical protein
MSVASAKRSRSRLTAWSLLWFFADCAHGDGSGRLPSRDGEAAAPKAERTHQAPAGRRTTCGRRHILKGDSGPNKRTTLAVHLSEGAPMSRYIIVFLAAFGLLCSVVILDHLAGGYQDVVSVSEYSP